MRHSLQLSGVIAVVVAVSLVHAGAAPVAAPRVSKELAASCARKIEVIAKAPASGQPPRRTTLSEGELNSWMTITAVDRIPVGVTDPAVTLLDEGRLSGRAVVDLDLMGRRRGGGGLLDPWSYLGGRVPVVATGKLLTGAGVGRFVLESAQIGGITVPKRLLQEMLSFYAKSPTRPRGINMDEPFPLPVGIETLEVRTGQAVVVQ
ncbi:MAG: hypothetical protein ABL971_03055 [Vicinamibacterales bacterium]